MYFCPRCRTPLNEFDIEFNKNLHKNEDPRKHNCFNCVLDIGDSRKFYEELKKKEVRLKYSKLMSLYALVFFSFMLLVEFIDKTFFEGRLNYDFDKFENIFHYLYFLSLAICYVLIFLFVVYLIKLTGTFKETSKTDEIVEIGKHYESEIKSDGTIYTKEVTDYSGGWDGCFAIPFYAFIFLFFLVAFLPYTLYLMINIHLTMKERWPYEVIFAYKVTAKKIDPVNITKKDIERFETKKQEYDKKVSEERTKYSMLGSGAVDNMLPHIKPPTVAKITKEGICLIAKITGNEYSRNRLIFVFCKNKQNQIQEKIVANNYFVYSENSCGAKDWVEFGMEESEFKELQKYKNYM